MRRTREDTRGRLYRLARPADTPHTGTSDKSLPGPARPTYNAPLDTERRHYLSIFDGHGRALWLGRSKRLATADQRIVLHARDRGCTRPGCTVPGYLTQAHHMREWGHDGHTDIDDLTLACAPDNRMATEQGWTTHLGDTGRVEWIPPPKLDHGQPRINPFHLIETTIDYHRATRRDEAPGPHPETWPGPDGSWLDDPPPGDFDYDAALEEIQRSYGADDWERAG